LSGSRHRKQQEQGDRWQGATDFILLYQDNAQLQ